MFNPAANSYKEKEFWENASIQFEESPKEPKNLTSKKVAAVK
ncbi:MAG: hypothetical protein V7L21_27615 [Nostoc sp.]|nr:hypothetical protein [Nostoc sp. NMS9]